jgi:ArsR family transcriptional regulator
MLHLLRSREICVGDLVRSLRVPQAAASRHLAYLRRAGLVEARRQGLWMHYSLARPKSRLHRRLLACLGSCFQDLPQVTSDARRFEALRNAGCCPR